MRHIVLWRWKAGVADADVADALDGLVSAQRRCPGAVAVTWVVNAYDKSRGFTHAAVGDFVDAEAVQRWVTSADHDRVGARIAELCARVAVLDLPEPFPHPAASGEPPRR